MQAQVGTEPKATTKTRAATDERPAPADATKADPNTKTGTFRRTDEVPRRETTTRDERRERQGGGWLGVYVAEADEKNPAAGVQISQVFPASPAARAGFHAGDVITQVNEHKITDPQSFITVIETMPPGTKAAFAVQRNNQPFKLTATLGQNHWMVRGQDEDFDRDFDRGRGRSAGDDYPFEALQLEYDRRMAEQHERMEKMLLELKEEVHQLREELKAKK
jgi:predicted metalloprotease with PDZ domain